MGALAAALTALSALYWAWTAWAAARTISLLPRLADDRSPPPAAWPRVSLVVAARNEERELERAVRSRLEDDYPALEVVLVDDRSTDATPQLADALAARDPRVTVVHLTSLPEGWLGKLHAMQRGVEAARGEWLLFSDADVEFSPGTLRRAVSRCEHEGRDHMAVIPSFREHGFAVDATLDVFCRVLVTFGRLWQVADPRRRAAVGGGMFNLVRRSALERTPGLAHLRMEVAEDVALGQMLKRHGARPVVANAVGHVTLDFYRTLGEMARGLEKTGLMVIGRGRLSVLLAATTLGTAADLGYLAGLAHPQPAVRALAALTLVVAAAANVAVARWGGRAALPALAHPLGILALDWMAWRSAWLAWRRGGVVWRDTKYPLEALRAGSRLEL